MLHLWFSWGEPGERPDVTLQQSMAVLPEPVVSLRHCEERSRFAALAMTPTDAGRIIADSVRDDLHLADLANVGGR